MIRAVRFNNIFILSNLLFPLIMLIIYFLGLIKVGIFSSWIIGWVIVFLGFVFELVLFKKGLGKEGKPFIRNILGALITRLFCTLILVFISIRILELNQNNFIFSVFFFYIFYLINEIFYLNFRSN